MYFLSFSLFALPKDELYNNPKAIQYVNNSGQNLYALTVISDDSLYPYSIYFSNYSLVSKVEIILTISFSNENQLNEFNSKYVKSVNLEDAFISIRQLFSDKWLRPSFTTPSINAKNRDSLKSVEYHAYYSNLFD